MSLASQNASRSRGGRRAPAASAGDRERSLGVREQVAKPLELGRARMRPHPLVRPRIGDLDLVDEHVLGQRQDHRAGSSRRRHRERAGHELRDPRGALDLGDPLRHRVEHPAVVDLLERLAILHVAADLADQEDQRRRVLVGRVDADRGVGCPRPAGDEADAGLARQLAVRLGHVRGGGLVPAGDEPDRRVVERVEHREIALAGNAERELDAVQRQLVDQHLTAGAHGCRLGIRHVGIARLEADDVADSRVGPSGEQVAIDPHKLVAVHDPLDAQRPLGNRSEALPGGWVELPELASAASQLVGREEEFGARFRRRLLVSRRPASE